MICNQCPKQCNIDRETAVGFCHSPAAFRVARAALHFWEEPCISGKNGSGTVFFSGCNLQCVYCQNYEISRENKGTEITDDKLIAVFESLIAQGAENINLVNPTHYAERLAAVLSEWHSPVPIVYNSSGYESVATLRKLEGLVDIYLPDFKYIRPDKAQRYSGAADYPDVVKGALAEMRRQQPEDVFDSRGMLQKGMIIRHLILPANTHSSLAILNYLKMHFPDTTLSLMAQYTPCGELHAAPEIDRQITKREYNKVADYAVEAGFENIFLQKRSSSDKKFIPAFDFTGIM